MEKNIYLIDSRSSKQQAVIGNFVKTSILNDIVKKTYSLWNNLKTVCLNSGMKKVCRPIEWLCSYYSDVLDRKLTMRQTWLLINAQLAFGAAFFPVEAPWVVRIGCLVWVVSALLKCKRGLK